MQQNTGSDQGQHGLHTGISMQKYNESEYIHQKPLKLEMDSSK